MDARPAWSFVSKEVASQKSNPILTEEIVLYNGLGSHIETVPKENVERFFKVHHLTALLAT